MDTQKWEGLSYEEIERLIYGKKYKTRGNVNLFNDTLYLFDTGNANVSFKNICINYDCEDEDLKLLERAYFFHYVNNPDLTYVDHEVIGSFNIEHSEGTHYKLRSRRILTSIKDIESEEDYYLLFCDADGNIFYSPNFAVEYHNANNTWSDKIVRSQTFEGIEPTYKNEKVKMNDEKIDFIKGKNIKLEVSFDIDPDRTILNTALFFNNNKLIGSFELKEKTRCEYILKTNTKGFLWDKIENEEFYFLFCDTNGDYYQLDVEVNYQKFDWNKQVSLESMEHEWKTILPELKETNQIKVPSKMDFYKGLDITEKDKIEITFDEINILPTVALVNGEDTIVGCFQIVHHIIDNKEKYMLIADTKNLRFEGHNSTRYFFIFFDKNNGYKVPIEVNLQDLETTSTHLCIDFGTSNTTAGCFLDSKYVGNVSKLAINNGTIKLNAENITTFDHLELGNLYYKNIVPTVAYVDDCSDSENIKYLFGYYAKERIEKDKYCPKATCFMEMKRWTSNIDVDEEIQDSKGNKATVSRKEIIAKYLEFIIKASENQYKCHFKNIHISAPVKLKEKSLRIYADILQLLESDNDAKEAKYVLEREHAIDEGVAVLYNIIDNHIKDKSKSHEDQKSGGNNDYRALIIDCGGGTSDLASCRYTIEKDEDDIINLDITTEHMNGDINFGGNNLTYRIMQYMKVVYAEQFQKGTESKIDIDKIITQDENSLFSYIEGEKENDSDMEVNERYKEVYKKLEQAYEEAEKVIPTRYQEYENKTKDIYDKVKNNFYFLWEIAEEMKKEFYRNTSIVRYKFDKEVKSDKEVGLSVKYITDWQLSAFENGKLTEQQQPDRTFTVKEIDKLLRADIYYLVRKFLNNLYNNKTLESYEHIKLSGQSSKINIFMDSLKEFLPGKKIKSGGINSQRNDAEELKLLCLKGAMTYLHSLEKSNIEVNLKNETKTIPISVYIKNENNEDKEMFLQGSDWEQSVGKRRITSSGKEIYLYMKNIDKEIGEPYKYVYENVNWEKIEEKELQKLIDNSNIKQEDIDRLPQNKKYIFVLLDEKEWGFYILPIYRNDSSEIYTGKKEFCSFEMDILQETFFDGRK